MNVKRLLLGAALGGAVLIPAGAFADHTGASCGYATGDQAVAPVGPAVVYADANGGGGSSGTADQSAGACVGTTGSLEAGHSANKGSNRSAWYPLVRDGAYVMADGGTTNPDPADGYAGVSNYETGSTTCTNNETCSGSNGGGYVGAPGGPYAPVYVPVACGNTTGPSWDNSKRDGCETS